MQPAVFMNGTSEFPLWDGVESIQFRSAPGPQAKTRMREAGLLGASGLSAIPKPLRSGPLFFATHAYRMLVRASAVYW